MQPLPVNAKSRKAVSSKKIIRYLLLAVLLVALLLLGAYTKAVYAWLDQFYLNLFTEGGLLHSFQSSQATVDSSITKRSWTTIFSYGLAYTGLSMLFLHAYFHNWQKTKIVLGLYGLLFAFCAMLIMIGKFAHLLQANQLSRHLIELVVSPFPIVLLIPALSYLNPPKKAPLQ